MPKDFELLAWSHTIPLCEDLWLGMQARNIAMVDQLIIRDLEAQALEQFLEKEKGIRSTNGICRRRREPEMMPPRLIGVGSARWIGEGGTG